MENNLKTEVFRELRSKSRLECLEIAEKVPEVSFSLIYSIALNCYKSEPTYRRLAALKAYLDSEKAQAA